MEFYNKITGHIVATENPELIAIYQASDNFDAVPKKKAKKA